MGDYNTLFIDKKMDVVLELFEKQLKQQEEILEQLKALNYRIDKLEKKDEREGE